MFVLVGVALARSAMPKDQPYPRTYQRYWTAPDATGVYHVHPWPPDPTAQAWVLWSDEIATTGWAFLEVTGRQYTDLPSLLNVSYAAGFIEGFITAQRAGEFLSNTERGGGYDNLTEAFLDQNEQWIANMVASNGDDPYWQGIAMLREQYRGLADGYNANLPSGADPLTADMLRKLMLDQGDVYDVMCLVNISNCATSHPSETIARTRAPRTPKSRREARLRGDALLSASAARGHCTSLLRLADDFADIFVGHTTWDDINMATRIWKMYDLPNPPGVTGASRVGMSSYPLSLQSTDDFVYNNAQIVAVSSEIFPPCPNADVWKNITARGIVFEYLRNTLAMRFATSGPSWAEWFGKYQSSTYNNEWLVVDYKLFTPGQRPPPQTIWMVDQMPNMYTSYDLTDTVVAKGWFGSWNTQSDTKQFDLCGWNDFIKYTAETQGLDVAMDYSWCCQTRPRLMSRLLPKANTVEDFARACRHNNYENDFESLCNCTAETHSACKAIATRCDLAPLSGMGPGNFFGGACFAGLDSKVMTSAMAASFTAWGQSGPTHDDVAPFDFDTAKACEGYVHNGLPSTMAFDWVAIQFPPPE